MRVQREGGEEKTNESYLQLSFLLSPCICDNTLVRCTATVTVVERLVILKVSVVSLQAELLDIPYLFTIETLQ